MNIYELINQVKLNTGNLRYWPIVNLKDVELENIVLIAISNATKF